MKQTINLLETNQSQVLDSQMMLRVLGITVGLLFAVIAFILLLIAYEAWHLRSLSSEINNKSTQVTQVQENETILALRHQKASLETQLALSQEAKRLLQSHRNVSFAQLMMGLSRAHVKGAWITHIGTQPENKILVQGQAEDGQAVVEMLKLLGQQPGMQGMALNLISLTKDNENFYTFKISGKHARP